MSAFTYMFITFPFGYFLLDWHIIIAIGIIEFW